MPAQCAVMASWRLPRNAAALTTTVDPAMCGGGGVRVALNVGRVGQVAGVHRLEWRARPRRGLDRRGGRLTAWPPDRVP